ncbi:hypothetical protein [Dyella sp. 2HG41-7]|uniref:hypothetical protein n=1 Tax=Dyella sp. 2HG41-7 TaxID=2883239 RepID=UPI001F415A8D|nr:hypothetical protein [Dyella sp. 2HG41-7]
MTTTKLLAKTEDGSPSNVVPFRPARNRPQALSDPSFQAQPAQVKTFGVNAVEQEPLEQRLARRVERVLEALLYHALLEPGDLRGSACFSIQKRVSQLVSRDRLMAVARAAINLGMTSDLTRLAATVIVFELQAQSRWQDRMLRSFSAHRRQINQDTLAIARLLAWDMDALNVRPIDTFAKFL